MLRDSLMSVDRWPMQEILREHGVALRLGLVGEGDTPYVKTASEHKISDEDASDEDRVLRRDRHAAAASPVGRAGRAKVDR
jgi:hypothetical protein